VREQLDFVDCQGLAGAWSLGTVATGAFKLVHRASLPGGFGDDVMELNRTFFGPQWAQEVGTAAEWTPQNGVAYMSGTPPCSGFSVMNQSKKENARGPESNINNCMKELIAYAGRCRGADGLPGPEVVSFESVQGAFNQGRVLMQWLRNDLEERTGEKYDLTHVKMSGSSVGAAQMRHRYYPVFHRVPFGAERPAPRRVVTYQEAIGDLVGLEITPDEQPYGDIMPSDWALRKVRTDGAVDWHAAIGEDDRLGELLIESAAEHGWRAGEGFTELMARLPEPPEALKRRFPSAMRDWPDLRGWNWPRRIHPGRPGFVITGSGATQFVHWSEPRLLTMRELTRLMGYPDDWEWPVTRLTHIGGYIGKCCPVDSGQWLSEQVARSLEDPTLGHAEKVDHEEIGPFEYLFDCTLDYRRWDRRVSGFIPSPEWGKTLRKEWNNGST